MTYIQIVVAGVYYNHSNLDKAIVELRSSGVDERQISVLLPPDSTKRLSSRGISIHEIPGLGKLIAVGIMAAASGRSNVFDAALEFVGILSRMGMPPTAAAKYAGHLKGGGRLLTVFCRSAEQASRATSILQKTDAQEIDPPPPARRPILATVPQAVHYTAPATTLAGNVEARALKDEASRKQQWDIPLAHYIYPYTFSIVQDASNEAQGILGSGTGILWRDRCLIVATSHTLEHIPNERRCFLLPNPKGLAAQMSGSQVHRVRRLSLQDSKVISSDDDDLAAVVLADQPPNLRERHFYPLPENDVMPPPGCSVGFVGYPGPSAPKVETIQAVNPHCTSAYTVPCADSIDVGVAYSSKDVNPGGFGGAGFWYWQTAKYPTPSLFGIIRAYSQPAQILQGYRIERVIRFLQHKCEWSGCP